MTPRQWMAFEEFVQDHGDALVRLSFALCGDRGKAEDAERKALTRAAAAPQSGWQLPGRPG